jgi:hypothetical protein
VYIKIIFFVNIILLIKLIFLIFLIYKLFSINLKNEVRSFLLYWGLGIGDWGLGIGQSPNPQSPIPKIKNSLFK